MHEETLKALAGAVEAVREPGQDRWELQRLRLPADIAQRYDSVLEKFERTIDPMEILDKACPLCPKRSHPERAQANLREICVPADS